MPNVPNLYAHGGGYVGLSHGQSQYDPSQHRLGTLCPAVAAHNQIIAFVPTQHPGRCVFPAVGISLIPLGGKHHVVE